jgi:signal transduction histidine kinase
MFRTGQLFGSHIAVINALVGQLQTSLSDKSVTELHAGVAQMQRLLADFGRFTPDAAPELRPLDLGYLTRATVGALKASIDVPIEPTISGPLKVNGDARLLSEAIRELVENAAQAIHQAKSRTRFIRVRAALERAGSESMALLEVTDSGPGVLAKNRQNIFHPLFTTKERGNGLGLMIVWDIIEQHKGTIEEAGEPGQGARFLVRLPLVT